MNKKVSRRLFWNRKKPNDEERDDLELAETAKKKLTLHHCQMGPEVFFWIVCHLALVIFTSNEKSEGFEKKYQKFIRTYVCAYKHNKID